MHFIDLFLFKYIPDKIPKIINSITCADFRIKCTLRKEEPSIPSVQKIFLRKLVTHKLIKREIGLGKTEFPHININITQINIINNFFRTVLHHLHKLQHSQF